MTTVSDPGGADEQSLSVDGDDETSEVSAADLGLTVQQASDPDWLGGGLDTLGACPAA